MLHRQLAPLDAHLLDRGPLDSGPRWLVPALVAAAAASGGLLFWTIGANAFALLFFAGFVAMLVAAFVLERRAARVPEAPAVAVPDLGLVGAALSLLDEPAVLTDADGQLLVANTAYCEHFLGGPPPLQIDAGDEAHRRLLEARTRAWRDGSATAEVGELSIEVGRAGARGDLLLWRFPRMNRADPVAAAADAFAGGAGERFAAAGVLAALVDGEGRLVIANTAFAERALPVAEAGDAPLFADLTDSAGDARLRLRAEGREGAPLHAVHVPLNPAERAGPGTWFLFDPGEPRDGGGANLQSLLDVLPVGLALVDRDGRFLTANKAFRTAGGIRGETLPAFPSDLVVKEDKGAVADAVRRNTRGPAMAGDLAVRLAHQPAEPVALTIAGLRGLGEPAVLLLLKDNSEEAKLKRQVAQATKMQAVGQLAGGVAHDFNNILTAILGHCDLMLMRHTPGDSDYDDIQQIRSNSNRAAGLTRQLLAFSRQQTLRPQILQLPDVVAEVSHLLKRLLGETVELVLKHGRDLGPVRADPGQLEQVIVNLAVNARDAMQAREGGGTLTIQTYAVRADQVADLGSDILPTADYSALSIEDTGTGIPPSILGKVFEPFFTTKEVGKGTGLGLSTVYGIVKQSGGFIFADSKVGEGTRFTIYLPVHASDAPVASRAASKPKDSELWGTGTVLLVEDEPMVRTVAERALTRHGYTVVTANNGEEALEVIARGEPIALLISDVVMPLMDGPTMVREARKSRPDLPILFMSGYAEEQLRKSIDIDHVAFLPKPFSVQELAEAARKVLAAK